MIWIAVIIANNNESIDDKYHVRDPVKRKYQKFVCVCVGACV